jgi:hypothetical protein
MEILGRWFLKGTGMDGEATLEAEFWSVAVAGWRGRRGSAGSWAGLGWGGVVLQDCGEAQGEESGNTEVAPSAIFGEQR